MTVRQIAVRGALALAAAAMPVMLSLAPRASAADSSSVTTVVAVPFGNPNLLPLVGDWDGSGATQVGAYDPQTQRFYLGDFGGQAQQTLFLGDRGDRPLAGDWTGSGRSQIGVYRPSTQRFYLGDVGGQAQQSVLYGNPGWTPLVGDWFGSGRTEIGAYDPSTQRFYLGDDNGQATETLFFGNPGDVPIAGDWTGSGRTQIGVYRPSTQTFYLGDANGQAVETIHFGDPGDVPIAGDWNRSGRTQIGVYRPSTATFYLRVVNPAPSPASGLAPSTATPKPAGRPKHRAAPLRLSLRQSARALRNGHVLVLSGEVRGGSAGASLLVMFQARTGVHRWTTFAFVRSGPRGTFRYAYRFTRTTGIQRYAIRALMPTQRGYPFKARTSGTVQVRVVG